MRYHLIGNLGISMRGIEKYLLSMGNKVSGSDLKNGGHKASNITKDIDVVIRTSAVTPGSPGWPEVEEAQRLGIKVVKRSEFLGEITNGKKLIAISGMHGKTTITSLVGLLLIKAGYDPTVFVGERISELNDETVRLGKSDWFVMEACEYDRSFLDFYPQIIILSNIEKEHLDTYPGGISEIKDTFLEYLNHVPDDGIIIACKDDKNVLEVVEKRKTKAKIIYYGLSSEKYNHLPYPLLLPGQHNVLNALSVLALAEYLQIEKDIIRDVLTGFKGAHRRFEKRGIYKGADLIDDYGHHPTEIKTTIAALSERYPNKKKFVVFWPHQYKRIVPLMDEFSRSFGQADEVIVKPIFLVPGRDEKLPVSSSDFVDKINRLSKKALYMESDEEIVEYLRKNLDDDSVLLTIGIPPVYEIINTLLKK